MCLFALSLSSLLFDIANAVLAGISSSKKREFLADRLSVIREVHVTFIRDKLERSPSERGDQEAHADSRVAHVRRIQSFHDITVF